MALTLFDLPPRTDEPILKSIAETDMYKLTMSRVQRRLLRRLREEGRHQDVVTTFEFTNRTKAVPLATTIDPVRLRAELSVIPTLGFLDGELQGIRTIKGASGNDLFDDEDIAAFAALKLPTVEVEVVGEQFRIHSTGSWPAVTFVETLVLNVVNELYYEALRGRDGLLPGSAALLQHYVAGLDRLDRKIARIKAVRASIMEFGNRRHNSSWWHEQVLKRLVEGLGELLLGTSNVHLALKYGIKPMGTFAHEMYMIYSAVYRATHQELVSSHGYVLRDWRETYGDDLSVALTDTYGTGFFFQDMIKEVAKQWQWLRHDSGDPFVFGERAIQFYRQLGIDPATKGIVFSDGLTVEVIEALQRRFGGRIKLMYGWGTDLTNDLGYKSLSLVMKAVRACGLDTVKLSDNPAKATGPEQLVALFKFLFNYKEGTYVECER